jgi:hypothetical protein
LPRVSIVELAVELPADATVDLFLLQLQSPAPGTAGAPGKLVDTIAARRAEFFAAFSNWISTSYCQQHTQRPFFVVAPELSVSVTHVGILENLLASIDRPGFVIVGLEFLRWSEYRELLHSMNEMPDRASWLEDGQPEHWINAALILIRDAMGTIHRFIQPKRNPSDMEAATHFPCRNVLLFQSQRQTQGAHLNFCVQICADFTNHEVVARLRRAIEDRSPGRPLDFTFVLQRNEDQAAPQFKRSIQAYFEPPIGMAETTRGSLIFLNNARGVTDTAAMWGDSMLLFPFQKWRSDGAPTYWLRNDGPHNHQGVLLREGGPAAFWLRYKPQYLVNPIPGSGQPGPFVDSHALAVRIVEDVFPAAPQFASIPPVAHWLGQQWSGGRGRISAILNDAGRPKALQEAGDGAYDEALGEWTSVASSDEGVAKALVGLYFCCFTQQGYPASTVEPRQWVSSTEDGARRFLSSVALLRLGMAGREVTPTVSAAVHAQGGDVRIALAWGGGSKLADAMIVALLRSVSEVASRDKLPDLVVLVAPLDAPDDERLADIVKKTSPYITDAEVPGSGDAGADDITRPADERPLRFICDQRVWAAVSGANSVDEARANLAVVLGVV